MLLKSLYPLFQHYEVVQSGHFSFNSFLFKNENFFQTNIKNYIIILYTLHKPIFIHRRVDCLEYPDDTVYNESTFIFLKSIENSFSIIYDNIIRRFCEQYFKEKENIL